jgi:hypothetical protein
VREAGIAACCFLLFVCFFFIGIPNRGEWKIDEVVGRVGLRADWQGGYNDPFTLSLGNLGETSVSVQITEWHHPGGDKTLSVEVLGPGEMVQAVSRAGQGIYVQEASGFLAGFIRLEPRHPQEL